ncbi:hypothetical protein PG995_015805 [Apiospora arundinis]
MSLSHPDSHSQTQYSRPEGSLGSVLQLMEKPSRHWSHVGGSAQPWELVGCGHGGGRRGAAVAIATERRAAVASPAGERVGVAVRVAVEALVGLLTAVEGRALAVVGVAGAPGVPLAHAKGQAGAAGVVLARLVETEVLEARVAVGRVGTAFGPRVAYVGRDGVLGPHDEEVPEAVYSLCEEMLDAKLDEAEPVILWDVLADSEDVLDDDVVSNAADSVCEELLDAQLDEAVPVTLWDILVDADELLVLVKLVVKLRVGRGHW